MQTFVQAVLLIAAGLGDAPGGVGGRFHADEAGQTGEETAGEEGDRHDVVLHVEVGHHGEDDGNDNEEEGNNFVLLLEVGHGAFAHVARYLLHAVCAFIGLLHVEEEYSGECQCDDGGNWNDPE